jgi:glutaredoxin
MSEGESSPSRVHPILNPWGLEPRALVLYCILVVLLAVFSVDRIAAWTILPAADSREVVLVGSRTCPHSRAVRERLREAGIPFREIRSEDDPLESALAAWALQSLRVPIVLVGPEIVYGNRREKIDAALAKLGYPASRADAEPSDPAPVW